MLDRDPVVSIIIPVFNRFSYANRSIDSVINQKYKSWELFIIDDCSISDFTLSQEYLGIENITVLRNKENLGSGLSRQRGLNLANGKYVVFLDSDDYYHPDFLTKMVDEIGKNENFIGVYCFSQFTSNKIVKSDYSAKNILPTLFDLKRPWTTCSWIWQRSLVSTWKNLRTNQDSLFEIDNAIVCNRISYVPEVLCFIDKETKENSQDLVGDHKGELNRNIVVNYALDNIEKFKKDLDYLKIKDSIFNRMIYVTAKLSGYGEQKLVFKNGLKLLANYRYSGIIVLLLAFCVGKNTIINGWCKRIINKLG